MQAQRGSAIICVLMATGGLLTLMSLITRYTTYGIDIAHQRVLYEQRYFAARGLLNYGLLLAEKSIVQDRETIRIDKWMAEYTGNIIVSTKDDTVEVHADLYFSPKEFVTMNQTILKSEKYPNY